MDSSVSHFGHWHGSKSFQKRVCTNGLLAFNQTSEGVYLRSASSSSFKIVGTVTTEQQIGQLQRVVGVLAFPELTANGNLDTASIEKYIK